MKRLLLSIGVFFLTFSASATEADQVLDHEQVAPTVLETIIKTLGNPWDCEDNPWGGWNDKC
ncbi:MAG: hypothetical protein H6624_19650 [Bdellovibrionaceae bacterium]|nr:hypothetical protein [Bdellovibrionales bacterium]MCB9086565.1 hypothetical protein [Pseudobdellovibrionaceae bacterium]